MLAAQDLGIAGLIVLFTIAVSSLIIMILFLCFGTSVLHDDLLSRLNLSISDLKPEVMIILLLNLWRYLC